MTLPQLPSDEEAELIAFKFLSDDTLRNIAREQMVETLQERMQVLMTRNNMGTIIGAEYDELANLVERGQRLTLRKAWAAGILMERGHSITGDDLTMESEWIILGENKNQIITDHWSNPASEALYKSQYVTAPLYREEIEKTHECLGCSFFAAFNADWGLCTFEKSPHHLETVFEHFTCPAFVFEGWGPHSFTEDTRFHCRCEGIDAEYWDNAAKNLNKSNKDQE
jgi:hypothetical protein